MVKSTRIAGSLALLLFSSLSVCSSLIVPGRTQHDTRNSDGFAHLKRGLVTDVKDFLAGSSSSAPQGPAPERTVTVVTDTLAVDPVTIEGSKYPIFPSQAYILFGPTDREGPVKVELVTPTIDSVPRGLAISVMDFSQLSAPDLARQAVYPIPRGLTRKMHTLSVNTTMTNAQIFFRRRSSTPKSTPRSMIEDLWLEMGMTGGFNVYKYNFGDSNELALKILGLSPFVQPTTADETKQKEAADKLKDELKLVKTLMLMNGTEWAIAQRTRNGRDGVARRPAEHIFYEIPAAPGSPLKDQRLLFEMDKRDTGWTGIQWRMRRVTNQALADAAVLSRDPRLTSDVLPLSQRGSFMRRR